MRLAHLRKKFGIIFLSILLVPAIVTAMQYHSRADDEFPTDLFALDGEENIADENPWNEGIFASYYGSVKGRKYYGCIDNLLKGAAGQAVQNMNIACGFKEDEGL